MILPVHTETTLVLVEGTWGGLWAQDTGPGCFVDFLRQPRGGRTFKVVNFRGWSGDVNGTVAQRRRGNRDWIAGGWSLGYFLQLHPGAAVLTHSHGVAPVLYQAKQYGQPVRRLLTVCAPPRKEFQQLATEALDNGLIEGWRQIYADGWDSWARLGQVFDGAWGWDRCFADYRIEQAPEKKIGHSKIFDPEHRDLFVTRGHLEFLHGL